MAHPRLRFLAAPAVILAVACFGGGGGEEPTPTPTPTATPSPGDRAEEALAAYVATTTAVGFVADCSKANVNIDVGKICASFSGERGDQRAYVLGLTFSEFGEWAIVEERNGAWRVVKTIPITFDSLAVPGIPWPLRTSVDVVVTGTGRCLNVREGPSLAEAAVDCIDEGATITLAAGPTLADEIEWWQVDGRSGWVSGDYLRYPDAAE